MNLNLVQNGIFPITRDAEGQNLSGTPDTGYSISGTIQGEGKWMGIPCIFVRTSGCNLRCAWIGAGGLGSLCDTPYSSHKPEKNQMSSKAIFDLVAENAGQFIKHVVISGGEPMLQPKGLAELTAIFRYYDFKITIETNGTVFDEQVAKNVHLASLSPKLSSSTPFESNLAGTGVEFNQRWMEKHEADRINIPVIRQWVNYMYENGREFQLKFVVADEHDLYEIKEIVAQLGKRVQNSDVLLMPEGVTPEELMLKTNWVTRMCIENGYRFAPRIHTLLWGTLRGV